MVSHANKGITKTHIIHSLYVLYARPWFQVHITVKEPHGFKSVVKHSEWLSVMDDEIINLKHNNTWCLVPHPYDHNDVGC
jgi:hypothetical protein